MKLIQVLGPGCAKCTEAARIAAEAVAESGVEAKVEKVEDIQKIMEFGVFSTPAVVVDGKVKVVGRVPSKKDVAAWLAEA